MIQDLSGNIDYDECGVGPTIVMVPGSCSTGAAWKPVIAALGVRFRCVTTSLLGYGGTAERRTANDQSISHEAEVVEEVIRKADQGVHLVGHSFGGLVALAVALRNHASLQSLTVLEAPAAEILKGNEEQHYQTFRDMTEDYFTAFQSGEAEAIKKMIDFYGGPGTFTSWPPRVRAYAIETTPVNILDWASAYGFPLSALTLASIDIPTLFCWGNQSQPAVQRANALLSDSIERSKQSTVHGAAHFMIATHANEVAQLIASHVAVAERNRGSKVLDRA